MRSKTQRGPFFPRSSGLLLLLPGLVLCGLVFLGALASLVVTSFQVYTPGRIGSQVGGGFTWENYLDLVQTRTYIVYLLITLRISVIASAVSVIFAYPVALLVMGSGRKGLRRVVLYVLIGSFFLNGIARVYSWILVLGEGGVVNSILESLLGLTIVVINTETAVILGVIHFVLPIATLTLMASLSNIDLEILDSAASLGANDVQRFVRVTVPLSLPGAIAAFSLSFTLSVSAFVVPLLLGGGIVVMVSNLVYNRFSEIANYPSGAALAILLLLVSVTIAYTVERGLTNRLRWLHRER